MSCWRSFGAAEFLNLCLRGLIFWLLAFGAGGCLFWTDVVDALRGFGLVGWCLESVFADTNAATICNFYPAPMSIWNRPRDSEKPRRSKRNIFLSEPVAFRRVYGLESHSRTSGESNHHQQSVSDVSRSKRNIGPCKA